MSRLHSYCITAKILLALALLKIGLLIVRLFTERNTFYRYSLWKGYFCTEKVLASMGLVYFRSPLRSDLLIRIDT